jgi:hypothetical protein
MYPYMAIFPLGTQTTTLTPHLPLPTFAWGFNISELWKRGPRRDAAGTCGALIFRGAGPCRDAAGRERVPNAVKSVKSAWRARALSKSWALQGLQRPAFTERVLNDGAQPAFATIEPVVQGAVLHNSCTGRFHVKPKRDELRRHHDTIRGMMATSSHVFSDFLLALAGYLMGI